MHNQAVQVPVVGVGLLFEPFAQAHGHPKRYARHLFHTPSLPDGTGIMVHAADCSIQNMLTYDKSRQHSDSEIFCMARPSSRDYPVLRVDRFEIDRETQTLIAMLLNDPCSYCGGPGGTVDHIVPVSKGGALDWTNLTAACRSCNSRKSVKPLIDFMAEVPMLPREGRAPYVRPARQDRTGWKILQAPMDPQLWSRFKTYRYKNRYEKQGDAVRDLLIAGLTAWEAERESEGTPRGTYHQRLKGGAA